MMRQGRIRFARRALLAAFAALVHAACGSTSGGGSGNTNWLKPCTDSSECGGLTCLCHACLYPCSQKLDCTKPPEAACSSGPDASFGGTGGTGHTGGNGGAGITGGAGGAPSHSPEASTSTGGTSPEGSVEPGSGGAGGRPVSADAGPDGDASTEPPALGACSDFGFDHPSLFPSNVCGQIQDWVTPTAIDPANATRRGGLQYPRVLRRGTGFVGVGAVQAAGANPVPALYHFDASGNCVEKLGDDMVLRGDAYVTSAAETRGGTTAALVLLGGNRMGGNAQTLVIAGKHNIDPSFIGDAGASLMTQLGVGPDGKILLASLEYTGLVPQGLRLRLLAPDGSILKDVRRPDADYQPLVVTADDSGRFVLLLQPTAGSSSAATRVVALGADLSEVAGWDPPSGVIVNDVMAYGNHVLLAGQFTDSDSGGGPARGFLDSLAVPALTSEWAQPVYFETGPAEAIDVDANGSSWIIGATTTSTTSDPGVWIAAYDVGTTAAPTTITADPNVVPSHSWNPPFWSIRKQPNGSILAARDDLLSFCPLPSSLRDVP